MNLQQLKKQNSMRREILFRGKLVSSNEWVYGNFIHSKRFKGCSNEYRIHEQDTGIESDIDEGTICQYSGMKDCKGIKIFEDDIIRDGCRLLVVKFNNGSFNFWTKYNTMVIQADTTLFEVIGNIIENPNMFLNNLINIV